MVLMLTLLTYESIGNLNKPRQYSTMFERQERVAILLLLGVACVVITAHLFLGTLGKQPFARPFTNNSADGELVIAGGRIDQISITKNGGHMNVYIADITIFVPAQIAQELTLRKGDSISVYGVVQTYRGKKEIIVSSEKDISVNPAYIRNPSKE
jgi:DNA/RNA endonuclease YhcR with UshA esterase domain